MQYGCDVTFLTHQLSSFNFISLNVELKLSVNIFFHFISQKSLHRSHGFCNLKCTPTAHSY